MFFVSSTLLGRKAEAWDRHVTLMCLASIILVVLVIVGVDGVLFFFLRPSNSTFLTNVMAMVGSVGAMGVALILFIWRGCKALAQNFLDLPGFVSGLTLSTSPFQIRWRFLGLAAADILPPAQAQTLKNRWLEEYPLLYQAQMAAHRLNQSSEGVEEVWRKDWEPLRDQILSYWGQIDP